jgi:hypothetical protein
MTKKFISLLISVIMVVGLIPVMSVSAEPIIYRDDDFDAYTVKEFNLNFDAPKALNSYNTGSSESYNKTISIGKDLSLEIIGPTEGYDGEQTYVGEITINSSGATGQTPGTLRLFGSKDYVTEGVYVQEMDVYITDNPNSQEFIMSPIVIQRNKIGFGTSKNDWTDENTVTPGWHRVKAVTLINETGNNVIGYVDGKIVTYKEYRLEKADRYFQLDTYEKGYKTIRFDNIKLWANPTATTAYSLYSGATNIPKTEKVTVNFTEMLLDVPDASPASISKANVKMIESDGSADGKEIEIKSVTLGADKK